MIQSIQIQIQDVKEVEKSWALEREDDTIYSDPQNCWYVYNIWLVIIIYQQPMKLCIYFLYHIDAMHVGYTPYKYYGNPFSIQWDIIMFLSLGHINSFVTD